MTKVFPWATLLAALAAAVAAWRAAVETRKAAQGQLYTALHSEYGAPETLVALRTLREWHALHGDDSAQRWIQELRAGDAKAATVDLARRRLKFILMKAVDLHDAGCLTKDLTQRLLRFNGVSVFRVIVEPMEKVLNPNVDVTRFNRMYVLAGRSVTRGLIETRAGDLEELARELEG